MQRDIIKVRDNSKIAR